MLIEVEQAEIVRNVSRSFRELMDRHDPYGLEGWIKDAVLCRVREIQSFAKGIHQDFDAVNSGFVGPWSNGQVEGQMNRLKTLKRRQMYGRTSFALLRAWILQHVVSLTRTAKNVVSECRSTMLFTETAQEPRLY
ncbi:transposase [Alicyclobacillaceae bacterium I2511]|nr:transposase [Alicyclobacillaceae bacterium I2511]